MHKQNPSDVCGAVLHNTTVNIFRFVQNLEDCWNFWLLCCHNLHLSAGYFFSAQFLKFDLFNLIHYSVMLFFKYCNKHFSHFMRFILSLNSVSVCLKILNTTLTLAANSLILWQLPFKIVYFTHSHLCAIYGYFYSVFLVVIQE